MRSRGTVIRILLPALAGALLAPAVSAQNIIYVNQAAMGVDDGSSWADAFMYLQDALASARSGDEVWVASGTYRPDEGDGIAPGDRDASFYIPGGISVYGGFSGVEAAREERDWGVYETVLSGDLLENDDALFTRDNPLRMDNSFSVVQINDIVERVVFDGFIVSDGMQFGTPQALGSAVSVISHNVVDPADLVLIANCTIRQNVSLVGSVIIVIAPAGPEPSAIIENSVIRDNFGVGTAGINVSSGGTIIRKVVFHENTAGDAGAISTRNEDVYIIGSVIANNSGNHQIQFSASEFATVNRAVRMWDTEIVGNTSERGTVVVTRGELFSVNNIFHGNSSDNYGSAINVWFSDAQIINNVFAFNSVVDYGGVIDTDDSITTLANSIFWKNTSPSEQEFTSSDPVEDVVRVSHSILQYPLPANVLNLGGMKTGDPLFVDADGPDDIQGTADDDFRLEALSPAVDAGDISELPIDRFDLDDDADLIEAWPIDFAGRVRVFDGGSGAAVVDMGVFEFDAPPVGTSMRLQREAIPLTTHLFEVYPNPTKEWIGIRWNGPSAVRAEFDLLDLTGRRVDVLYDGFISEGQLVMPGVPAVASGIYFIRHSPTGSTVKLVVL